MRKFNHTRVSKIGEICLNVFEQKLPALFKSGFLRTSDPARATLFYHPACLVDTFFRSRLKTGRNKFRLTRLYELRVLSEIKAVGYGHMPHMIHALRCTTTHMPWGQVTWGNTAYPQLWLPVWLKSAMRLDAGRALALHSPQARSNDRVHPTIPPLPDHLCLPGRMSLGSGSAYVLKPSH